MQMSAMNNWYAVFKISEQSDTPRESITEEEVEGGDDDTTHIRVEDGDPANHRLSLLSSNMQANQETSLRSYLATRINKAKQISTGSMFETLQAGSIFEETVQVYYNILSSSEQDGSCCAKLFLVCFCVQTDSGLELFHADLDAYCLTLVPYLEMYMEATDISDYLNQLDSWYTRVICFVERCLDCLSEDLAVLVFASFSGDCVVFSDEVDAAVKRDIEHFVEASSLAPLLLEADDANSSSLSELAVLENSQVFTIHNDDGIHTVEPRKTTAFCRECVAGMRKMSEGNPFKMRQLVENYKLKSIQDMNTFKRLLKQAETDYYAVYKAYLFLTSSGNGAVLLRNAKLQAMSENSALQLTSSDNLHVACGDVASQASDILRCIETFITGKGGFEVISKQKQSSVTSSPTKPKLKV